MTRALYLAAILISFIGVVTLDRALDLGIVSRRWLRTALATVALFLAFDLTGAARGWFFSSPRYNVLIVPPGIPLEEPILLTFLTLVSLALWHGVRRLRQ